MTTTALDQAHTRLRAAILAGEGTYPDKLKAKPYAAQLQRLQIELLKLQRWVKTEGARVCVLFEGRDAAGKGGAIRRFTENLNPRGARVIALAKPSDVERTQWYFQRYVSELPSGGEICFFDRSWYNRAVVERVMGFCTTAEYERFTEQVSPFERMLVEDGIHLIKLWFTVGKEEQAKRFKDRRKDPLKQWKLSPVDEAAIERFEEYTDAVADMVMFSDSDVAPWTVINGNEKRRARLGALTHVLHAVPYEARDPSVIAPDPSVVAPAARLVDKDGLRLVR